MIYLIWIMMNMENKMIMAMITMKKMMSNHPHLNPRTVNRQQVRRHKQSKEFFRESDLFLQEKAQNIHLKMLRIKCFWGKREKFQIQFTSLIQKKLYCFIVLSSLQMKIQQLYFPTQNIVWDKIQLHRSYQLTVSY